MSLISLIYSKAAMPTPNTSSPVSIVGVSGTNTTINTLLTPYKWGGVQGTGATISYSFPTNPALFSTDVNAGYGNQQWEVSQFSAMTEEQKTATRAALDTWARVANITFTEVVTESASSVGDLRFSNSGFVGDEGASAWAYYPWPSSPNSGDVWIDPALPDNFDLALGEYGFSTLIHEIGHAIGLAHPFYDAFLSKPTLPPSQDNQRYTIMAYDLYGGATIEAYGPMLYDVLVIQYIYGANMETGKGDDVYKFGTDKEYFECIWDASGHDTFDLSEQTRNQVIDLRAGTFSSIGVKNNGQTGNGNVSIAFGAQIEDAIGGSGHDKITGNSAANDMDGGIGNDTIAGGAGNDTLTGGTGDDSMSGGDGDDLYFVDSAGDKVVELAAEGTDTVKSTVSYSFAAAPNVEHLELVGSGDLNGTGNASANTILGTDGKNLLDGGGGADTLTGGDGNDTYILDNAGDVVIELGDDSGDTVKSSAASLTVIAGIENYFFTGVSAFAFTGDGVDNTVASGAGNDTVDGAGGNDTLSGNGGTDSLVGGSGDDLIDGGAGNDKMKGAGGNDTYVINSVGDTIDEDGSADTNDLVKSSVTVNLAILGAGLIEHAILTGGAAINATGNGEDNALTGNGAANKLDGAAGADTMTGGNGADTYTVDNAGDKVVETTGGAAGGLDIVNSAVDFALGANLEKLTLTGKSNVDGAGNGLNNAIVGNEGDNRLDGSVGNDTMTGGKGSDVYVVDSALDVVNETIVNGSGGGIDTVESSVAFTLATRANIDNLTLLGSANINGIGNALANTIIGNSGNNSLDGGAGADVLKGGDGNDIYLFDNLGDTASETASTGTDELRTKVKIAAGFAGIENYTYLGTAAWSFAGTADDNKISGGATADTLSGGAGKDTLLGNGGNDLLVGNGDNDLLDGGAGNDKMKGGGGNDTYVINAAGDSVDEEGNADSDDLVKASVKISLAAGGFLAIEHVLLTGTAAINATGNGSDNELTGNDGANVLNGLGGADTLTGGKGGDTYVVDNVGDQVVESLGGAAGGVDTVLSSIDFSLAALVNVEKLTLAMGAGSIDATGNALNNTLTGNEAANILDGGAGNDTMVGGKGGDTYVVDSLTDVVTESILNSNGGGVDLVISSVNFSLATRTNIENLTLTGGAVNGTGNALNNHIIGSDGSNKLDGAGGNDVLEGGLGADTLIGGSGNDLLTGGVGIDSLNGGTGVDTFDYNALNEAGDIISGFVRGVGGDVLNLADLLDSFSIVGDAFDNDYLDFLQNGADTVVRVDADGGMNNVTVLATLLNVSLLETDTANFIVASA